MKLIIIFVLIFPIVYNILFVLKDPRWNCIVKCKSITHNGIMAPMTYFHSDLGTHSNSNTALIECDKSSFVRLLQQNLFTSHVTYTLYIPNICFVLRDL